MIKLTVKQKESLQKMEYTYAFEIEEQLLIFRILKADLYRFTNCAKFRKVTPLLEMFFDKKDLKILSHCGINDNLIAKCWDISFNENSIEELDDWDYDSQEIDTIEIPFVITSNS